MDKLFYLVLFCSLCTTVLSFLEPGKWTFPVSKKTCHYFQVHKALYANSVISVKILCDSVQPSDARVKIGWVVRKSPCFEEYLGPEVTMPDYLKWYYHCPAQQMGDFGYNEVTFLKKEDVELKCDHFIDQYLTKVETEFTTTNIVNDTYTCHLPQEKMYCDSSPQPITLPRDPSIEAVGEKVLEGNSPIRKRSVRDVSTVERPAVNISRILSPGAVTPDHQIIVPTDGVYMLILRVAASDENSIFDASVEIEMKGDRGYLSAAEWPLLPFYASMCIIYVVYALIWMINSAMQWRELLRIQFWVGGVIFLGMIEKAVFYAEHQSVNSTGKTSRETVLFAELLSCLKRTVARMLVIIVSLGFGIVKPRLGPMLHRVVCLGGLYFVLGSLEALLRIYKPKNDPTNQTLLAGVPLAILDSVICWWVFSSLVQTTRTLRLRRNLVKLNLYRQFTNTLICAVIGSVVFMIWQIHTHKLTSCLSDWKELWMDEAYWHVLFSIILFVIMILWRPTNNNQRYAFTPLLDASDDEDTEPLAGNIEHFGMKMRPQRRNSTGGNSSTSKDALLSKETEDDLKWVEDNIPSSLVDAAIPVLIDSDEELLTTRFERNKME
ncbi:Transmembrane protein 87A [Halotydeus destructor]|nr:Transmembrane protein 87A [Halotydeus destructor]